MNTKLLKLSGMVLALIACYPAIGQAAVPTSGAYVDDATDTYVEDAATKVLAGVNSVLCYMGAMGPELTVNTGAYIAMVDTNKCDSNSGGGKSKNKGAAYQAATVNATQLVGGPFQTSVWIPGRNSIEAYVTATLGAGSTAADGTVLPYGQYTMNWCATKSTRCDDEAGNITADATGLSYVRSGVDKSTGSGTTTEAALLNPSTVADSGSGALSSTSAAGTTSTINFAYNADYFLRDDGTGAKCFDRAEANASRSAWSYGLYSADGAQVTRNSGFPIQYADSTGTTQNGYVGFWGMWTPDGAALANGKTVQQVDYSTGAPVTTDYTLLQAGGKLIKHTTTKKTLADEDKLPFWFGSMYDLETAGAPLLTTGFAQYEMYWDNTAGQFFISGKLNETTYNMQPLATPVAVANADMVAATGFSYTYNDGTQDVTVSTNFGLNAWSNASQWNIDGESMKNLATTGSTTQVLVDSQDIVYPDATVGTLTCVVDCPQAIAADGTTATGNNDFLNDANTVTTVATAALKTYTLDAASGNLLSGTTAVLNLTATSQYSNKFNTQGSGKLVDSATWTTITTSNTTGTYSAADLDTVTTFYTWQSSSNSWDQLSVLKDAAGKPVKFDAPLSVTFVVPANTDTTAKIPYGDSAGATLPLQYGGFGDLSGIPTSCVDLTTNATCDFTAAFASADPTAAQVNFSFKPDFSIPEGSTVTDGTNTYYVKPLSLELRFKKLDTSVCTAAGVALPATTPTLPTIASWTDPALGAAPTPANKAPRVIQGVLKY